MTNQERVVNIVMGTATCDFCEIIEDPGAPCPYCERDARIVSQALADAGLLMPDLPEPMQHWEAERTGGDTGITVVRI